MPFLPPKQQCQSTEGKISQSVNQSINDILLYLGTQRVDNARIAENHQRQREKVSNEKERRGNRFLHGDTAVDAIRHTDSADDVRRETCHRYLKNWDSNPDRDQHGYMRALLQLCLQTSG